MSHKVDRKYVRWFLDDELKIKYDMENFLINGEGSPSFEKLDVVTSRDNHAFENCLVNRLEDKDYQFKTKCLAFLAKYYVKMQLFDKEILFARHRRGFLIGEICIRFHVSRSKAYDMLNFHYKNILKGFIEIYDDVYRDEEE